jgi:multidrug efflux system outer membrane protein
VYADPELNRLLEKVHSSNLDLRAAGSRIAESRAVAGERKSALGPAINFTSGAQRLRGGFVQGIVRIPQNPGAAPSGAVVSPFETGLVQGQFDMRWELDFFGTNRATLAASRADVLADEERREGVLLSVTAEAAINYFELRGLEERIAITNENLATQKDLLTLVVDRARAGLDSQLDVERQSVLAANTEASLSALNAERQVRLHRLAVLSGDRAYQIREGSLAFTLPRASLGGLTTDRFRRRPDVRVAEAEITAAIARLAAAKSDRYPKVALSGLVGRQATSFTTLSLGGGNFFSLGPQLQLPIFNYGRIRSNIDANDARLVQARISFEREILAAWEESNNALSNYQRQQERETALARSEKSAGAALDLAKDLQKAGLSDFLGVLDAQRSLLDARFQRSLARAQSFVESVLLFKAMAGAWPE